MDFAPHVIDRKDVNTMITGYLIEKYNNMGNAYTCNRLLEEAKNLGIDLQMIGACDSFLTDEGVINQGKVLEKRDFVILRYKGDLLRTEMSNLGRYCFNSEESYRTYMNKYQQVKRLHSDEFLIPRYMMGTCEIGYETVAKRLGRVFVVKGLESSMGREIWLIGNADEYAIWELKQRKDKEFLYEEFIQGSAGVDMRLYVLRGEVIGAMKRISDGDFRTNVALGATTEKLEITESFKKIGRDLYEQTGLDAMGIDLLYGDSKPYLCEINVMPGIKGMESTTGVNVAGRLMQFVKDTVRE